MSEHAFLAPSSAPLWVVCHGQPTMVAQAVSYVTGDSEASREGTAAHWALSEVLADRTVAVGQVTPQHFVLTREMVDAAEDVQRWVNELAATHGEQPYMWIEHRMPMNRIHPRNWGTADLILYFPKANVLYVIDYKFGHGWVEVFENWQVVDYTAGALEMLTLEMDVRTNNTEVVLVVIQPRSYHPDGSIRMWRTTQEGLRPYHVTLGQAANAACEPNPKLTPGTHCRRYYCAARHACPAAQNEANHAIDLTRKAVPFNLPPEVIGIELADLRKAIKALEARETGLAAQAEALMTRGDRVPGWGLERKPGNLTWTLEDAEVLAMGQVLGLNLTKPAAPVTPTQAKKLGMSDEMLTGLADRPMSAAKLVEQKDQDARRIFT